MLTLMLVAAAAAAPSQSELATCAAIMTVSYEREAEVAWDEKRALALGAAGYYTGRLESDLAATRNPFAPVTARQLVEQAYSELKPSDMKTKAQPCFDTYAAAVSP